MKRRHFLAAAGAATAGFVATGSSNVRAEDRPAEKRLQVYVCEECGAIVEVVEPGPPTLVHCGKPMKLLEEQTTGEGAAKHVPVIEKIEGGYKVKVGSIPHPMTRTHYIGWVDFYADGQTHRQYLPVEGAPEAVFKVDASKEISARAYCNLHGLWKSV
ncbi:desulfoferrodoxin [Thermostilla marina]